VTPDGVAARFLIHPDGAGGYQEGEEVLGLIEGDSFRQAELLSMFANLAERELSAERIMEVAGADDVFAEDPMWNLSDELGIKFPDVFD
jgi:hypothetical protein